VVGSHGALSLADVAKLAGVKRPVVSMWRKRELAGAPFPAADADGHFAADEIVDWLEMTGRGNNPEARADLAVQVATSTSMNPLRRSALITLLAARALLDEPLVSYTLDELLDEADAFDPDDDFLFSEVKSLDLGEYPTLAKQADAIAEAAWHPQAAYERLLAAQPGQENGSRLRPDLCELLSGLCHLLLRPEGELIDVRGECCDVVIAAGAEEDLPAPAIKTPADVPIRDAYRHYRVRGIAPVRCGITDDWDARPGSVTLVRIKDQNDFGLVDEARLQLSRSSTIIVVGPASLLTDAAPSEVESLRDEFIRQDRPQPAVLRAAARLPAGLTCGGSRQHLALWLLGPAPQPSPIWIGDLSGARFGRGTRQALLDDLQAVFQAPGNHAFATLHAVPRTVITASGGSLVDTGGATASVMVAAADDAARINELRRSLAAPIPEAFEYEPTALGDGVQRQIRLGDACQARQVKLLPGSRLGELPTGTTPLWTSDAVAAGMPASVDLLRLTHQRPDIRLTERDDVVFTAARKPVAVLDEAGGAAVAYPARILRITGGRLCPAAIVDAINAVPAGNAKWRTWLVPETQIDPGLAADILQSLQHWERQLHQRQALLEEFKVLITRSVLSGAIQVARPNEQKGK